MNNSKPNGLSHDETCMVDFAETSYNHVTRAGIEVCIYVTQSIICYHKSHSGIYTYFSASRQTGGAAR